jgi:hypothetical protein
MEGVTMFIKTLAVYMLAVGAGPKQCPRELVPVLF